MNFEALTKIDLRTAWKHEEYDFSKWLAEEENLEILSDEIGIEFSNVQREVSTGSYSVDIVAEEVATGKVIVIENQLENTNHDHLGKIITYASGFDAEIIIWIVKDYKEEHKNAIDWLNENTNSKINIFLIRIELWQIGESPFAVKFNIISQPNNWVKTLIGNGNKGITETKLLQLDFWDKFNQYCKERNSKLRLRKAQPQQWHDIKYGIKDSHICLTVNSITKNIACEIYIPNNKDYFFYLLENKKQIEESLKIDLDWQELPNKKASRIKFSKAYSWENEENWIKIFEWMKNQAERFQEVFSKYILNP